MNVQFDVSIPIDSAVAVRNKIRALQAEVDKALTAVEKKIKQGKAKAVEERDTLLRQKRMITERNLLRLATVHGTSVIEGMEDGAVLKWLGDNGVNRGRPRNAA